MYDLGSVFKSNFKASCAYHAITIFAVFLRKIQPYFLLFAFFFTFSLESKRNLTWPDSSLSGKKCGFGLIDGHTSCREFNVGEGFLPVLLT